MTDFNKFGAWMFTCGSVFGFVVGLVLGWWLT